MMENQERPSVFGIQLDEASKNNLRTMASWGLIIVITTLIRYVLAIIQYFKEKNAISASYSEELGYTEVADRDTLPYVIIVTVIGLLLCYFLYRFSDLTKKGIENQNQADLNAGLGNLKNYFLTLGIISIIVIALALIALVFFSTMM